jgi:hypothetical protein
MLTDLIRTLIYNRGRLYQASMNAAADFIADTPHCHNPPEMQQFTHALFSPG